jgi:hypothetical protein
VTTAYIASERRSHFFTLGLVCLFVGGLGFALGSMLSSRSTPKTGDAVCVPGYKRIGDRPLEIQVGSYWSFSVNGILLGCQDGLDSLRPQDIAIAEAEIGNLVDQSQSPRRSRVRRIFFRSQLLRNQTTLSALTL